MIKVKLLLVTISIGVIFCILSCSEKNPTKSVETAQLSGYVYQTQNGFSNRISDAEISIGIYKAISDSIGRYTLEVPIGEQIIQISYEQFDTITDTINIRGDRSYLINLLNGPSFSVSGIVTDTLGAVVEGAVVQLEHLRDTTDINGAYLFQNVLSGQRSLFCDFSDYFIFTDSFEITNDDILKNINLVRQGYNISGIVSHPVDSLLSGVEVVLDDSLYDTTNINGEYLFENIYVGEHQLQVNSEIYDNQVIDFSLGKVDLEQRIELVKTIFYIQTIDTLWIEKDASVVYKSENEEFANVNGGDSQIIGALVDIIDVFSHIDGPYYYNMTRRSYVTLPIFDTTLVDSATLVISATENRFYNLYDNIRFSSVMNQWDEMKITWNNQPAVKNNSVDIHTPIRDSLIWVINITDNLNIFTNIYGFRISIPNESCYGICFSLLQFYASESTILDKRPYILLYKTE